MTHRRAYPPDYCSRDDLAYRLAVSPGCIDQMVRRGELPPPHRYSGADRWRWSDVDVWMDRLRTAPGIDRVGTAADPAIQGLSNVTLARARIPRHLAGT